MTGGAWRNSGSERPSSATTLFADASAPHISRSHSIACSVDDSSWAAM